jgi:hypothetical protein
MGALSLTTAGILVTTAGLISGILLITVGLISGILLITVGLPMDLIIIQVECILIIIQEECTPLPHLEDFLSYHLRCVE